MELALGSIFHSCFEIQIQIQPPLSQASWNNTKTQTDKQTAQRQTKRTTDHITNDHRPKKQKQMTKEWTNNVYTNEDRYIWLRPFSTVIGADPKENIIQRKCCYTAPIKKIKILVPFSKNPLSDFSLNFITLFFIYNFF